MLFLAVEQLQQILESIQKMLVSHGYVVQEAPRVRFMGFARDALLLKICAYIATKDFATYLECAEDVNLKVLYIIDEIVTRLALPA